MQIIVPQYLGHLTAYLAKIGIAPIEFYNGLLFQSKLYAIYSLILLAALALTSGAMIFWGRYYLKYAAFLGSKERLGIGLLFTTYFLFSGILLWIIDNSILLIISSLTDPHTWVLLMLLETVKWSI